jgi:hypothetical protein
VWVGCNETNEYPSTAKINLRSSASYTPVHRKTSARASPPRVCAH